MPAITRKGDLEAPHLGCGVPTRMGAVRSVFATGKPISCQFHLNFPHLVPCPPKCCIHTFPLIMGSPDVFAEGRAVGRVGDPTCTVVIQGSPNVFANGGGPSFSLMAAATSLAGSYAMGSLFPGGLGKGVSPTGTDIAGTPF
jgi:uncharacterized Zn-binding protein involved in type VI secretion